MLKLLDLKLATLPNAEYRQVHSPAITDNGFSIALFIDNTTIAMSRPGGPLNDGEAAA